MAIDLTSELSLGSVVLTRDAALAYTYYLPRGMTFSAGATVALRFTDRSGGEYDNSPFAGTVSTDRTKATWTIDPLFLNSIPAGANFEVFIVDSYGRSTTTAASATDTITATGHGLSDGNPICFTSVGVATAINVNTTYYVVSSSANTFKVALTVGGTALTIGTASLVFVRPATYKVRYGRVVRKEVSFPLNPLNVEIPPLMYEDDMQRSMPGPRWLIKGGRMSMQTLTGITAGVSYPVGYGMATRNTITDVWGNSLNLYTKAGAQWYGPLQSDAIEMNVGLADGNNGTFTAVFASNYSMTKWLGVRFQNAYTNPAIPVPADRYVLKIQVVYGSAWDTTATVGSFVNYTQPAAGSLFKITYSGLSKSVSVFTPASATTPALTTSTSSTAAQTGAGYRYLGATSEGSFAYSGPRLYYWKVKDAV